MLNTQVFRIFTCNKKTINQKQSVHQIEPWASEYQNSAPECALRKDISLSHTIRRSLTNEQNYQII